MAEQHGHGPGHRGGDQLGGTSFELADVCQRQRHIEFQRRAVGTQRLCDGFAHLP
ncbi:Uncharacterised protein [Mycobacteroides abscessus subsp. abscessus]|nr:Uncharacterised protein [Mycobacteroides abscessus subsp. abscessus]